MKIISSKQGVDQVLYFTFSSNGPLVIDAPKNSV